MFMSTYCGLILLLASVSLAVPKQSSNGCGYAGCNLGDPNQINVHLVSHTHDDVGWIVTVDQYYYSEVQYILDSVVVALDQNPDRRFIYVEIAYFWRWWNEQTDAIREKVKGFVNDGRLEFISGGWCMNDEAGTHYNSIIDQHSLGAAFLRDTFGECGRPKIGWQIDPFGHSREQASLFAQMGFDGLFFARADYQDINKRSGSKAMEMIWKASANLDRQSWLFTGILPSFYCTPIEYDDIRDDPNLHDYNVPNVVQGLIQYANNTAQRFATNHIIVPIGCDFDFQSALHQFKNIDKLIKYVNAEQSNGSKVNIFYSTPSCYLYALNQANITWPSKSDDFFPYANHPHGYWTGYFTSRPALKRYERYTNNILQVTKQLNALSNIQAGNLIFNLSEPMGVVQHHDGVSGTEKQVVAFDYAERLSDGINAAQSVISQAYSKLLTKPSQRPPSTPQFLCQLSNISQCLELDGQERFTLTLWNPTIHPVTQHARVPVTTDYTVRDSTGQTINTELIPISEPTQLVPGRTTMAKQQVIFKASLPALGFNTYYFEKKADHERNTGSHVKITQNDACTLQNQYLQVQIDSQGNLVQIVNRNKSITLPFSGQGFYWYAGHPNNGSGDDSQASGAYVFRPLTQTAQPVSTSRTVTCITAQTVQTAIITFNNWTSQEISLYDNGQVVEVEWIVGPIPIDDKIGKEIIIRYDTDIQSQGKYYTDANGREVLERVRDYRPTWNYSINEPVSGNYYPINSRIWVKDQNRQLTVLTDRSQGGGSIHDGSVEILLHRRLLYDDNFGVSENLNETAFGTGLVIRGRHVLIVEPPVSSALAHRVGAQQAYMHPLATYSLVQQTYTDYSASYYLTWSALTDTLPLNVHLLTLDQLGSKNYLVRVENYFELNEDDTYSHPVTFDLQSIFKSIGSISNTVELTLAANLPLSDLQRLNWMTNDDEELNQMNVPHEVSSKPQATTVTLNPMQIRTFNVTIA